MAQTSLGTILPSTSPVIYGVSKSTFPIVKKNRKKWPPNKKNPVPSIGPAFPRNYLPPGAILDHLGAWPKGPNKGHGLLFNHAGRLEGSHEIKEGLIFPDKLKEVDEEYYDIELSYSCDVCHGIGISNIAFRTQNERDKKRPEYIEPESAEDAGFYDCQACAGKGRPPIPWGEIMK